MISRLDILNDNIGFVNLEAHCADDLSVVNAARVSVNKRSHWNTEKIDDQCYCEDSTKSCDCYEYKVVLKEEDAGLIRFLMKNKHGTPFEHNFFRFHVKAPIFVFREWHRHRIGVSINEMSGRYTELPEEFYIPSGDQIRRQTGKPGSYVFKPVSSSIYEKGYRLAVEDACGTAFGVYHELLAQGFAKEIARVVLPVSTYSEMWWSCNARSLMSFLELRTHETAQWEIRQYACAMMEVFKQVMPITAQAFEENGRIAP